MRPNATLKSEASKENPPCHNYNISQDNIRGPNILLLLLKWTGTPIFDETSSKIFSIKNFVIKSFAVVMHLMQAYMVFGAVKSPSLGVLVLPLMVTSFLSVVIWHNVNRKRKTM